MPGRWTPLLVCVGVVAGCASEGTSVPAGGPPAAPVTIAVPTSAAPPVSTEPATSTTATTALPTTTTIRIGPMTPTDPTRITPEQQEAIELLGASDAGPPEHAEGHSHAGTNLEYPLFTGVAELLANEWIRAVTSTSRVDTVEKAARLGYVRAAAPGSGVGTHWVLWSQIAEPFDAARPAMLLFDERRTPAELVGYSYWLQSDEVPEGFPGPFDVWHQHNGYCVVNGWVDRENVPGADECAGTYLAGGDLWMLHAWVVPGWENPRGRFAVFHPALCPSNTSGPDIARCPTD